jgi:hypothetical protein
LVVGATAGVTNAVGEGFPPSAVTLFRTSQRVSDFMKHDLLKVVVAGCGSEVFGDRNALCAMVALSKTSGRSIPLKPPLCGQSVGYQQRVGSCFAARKIGHAIRVVMLEGAGESFPQDQG